MSEHFQFQLGGPYFDGNWNNGTHMWIENYYASIQIDL